MINDLQDMSILFDRVWLEENFPNTIIDDCGANKLGVKLNLSKEVMEMINDEEVRDQISLELTMILGEADTEHFVYVLNGLQSISMHPKNKLYSENTNIDKSKLEKKEIKKYKEAIEKLISVKGKCEALINEIPKLYEVKTIERYGVKFKEISRR